MDQLRELVRLMDDGVGMNQLVKVSDQPTPWFYCHTFSKLTLIAVQQECTNL